MVVLNATYPAEFKTLAVPVATVFPDPADGPTTPPSIRGHEHYVLGANMTRACECS